MTRIGIRLDAGGVGIDFAAPRYVGRQRIAERRLMIFMS